MPQLIKKDSKVIRQSGTNGVLGVNRLGNYLSINAGAVIRTASNAGIDYAATQDFAFHIMFKPVTKSTSNRYMFSRLAETSPGTKGYAFIINETDTVNNLFTLRLIGIREFNSGGATVQNVEATSVPFSLSRSIFNSLGFVKVGTNANNFQFYVGAQPVAVASVVNTYTGASILHTGSFSSTFFPTENYAADVANFMLFNAAASQAQIEEIMNFDGVAIPTGLKSNVSLNVQLNEKSGTTAKDISSNANNLTLTGFTSTSLGGTNSWKSGITYSSITS